MKNLPETLCLALLSAIAVPAFAADTKKPWSDLEFSYGGLIHTDTVDFDPDVTPLENTTDFRRLRLKSDLRYNDWRLRADYDWGVAPGWRSTFLEYRGFRKQRIVVGNHVAPFSMEELKSSRHLGLNERSIASALAPGMLVGASWRTWRDRWSFHAGLFGDALDNLDRRRLPGESVIARATYAPVNRDGLTVHLGSAVEFRDVDDGESVRLRVRPGTRLTDRRLVDTRNIDGVEASQSLGLEFGLSWGRFRLQSEMIQTRLDAPEGELGFSSQYVMAAYVIGGRAYEYSHSRGNFKTVRPESDWGSLELLARRASLDLDDGLVTGGKQYETTVGAAWIYNKYLRVMLSVSQIEATPNRDGVDEDVTVGSLRLQLTF
ncbi:MAG: porin [Woeseiaceae bacterium]|jgi:phosphate-selective porin OprO/OprP|nr:porin [Woeseiaceae bacterium]